VSRGDLGAFAHAESAAHAIVFALAGSLDHEAGGEIALNLARLYDFMLRHLAEGLVARNAGHMDHVRGLLTELRDGFAGATS
jgi:flagellar protein FliS